MDGILQGLYRSVMHFWYSEHFGLGVWEFDHVQCIWTCIGIFFTMEGVWSWIDSRLMVMYNLHWCLLVRMGSAAYTKHNFEAGYKACMR